MSVSTKEKSTMISHNLMHGIIIILLLANIVISIVAMSNNNTKTIINEMEAMKVWWIENYEKLQKIMQSDAYKQNYSDNLDAMIMQMETPVQDTTDIAWPEENIPNEATSVSTWTENTIPEIRWDE